MKTIIAILGALLVISAMSCKKDVTPVNTTNYAALLIGKWNEDSFKWKYPDGAGAVISASWHQYIEFTNNGIENEHYLLGSGDYEDVTLSYHVSADSLFGQAISLSSPLLIQSISSNKLTLYSNRLINGETYENWDYFSK